MNNKFRRNINLIIQFIRLALISGIVFILIMLVAGAVLTYIYRDEAKDLIIQSLNQNLKTEIQVGKIKLDLFRRFPNASLTFEDVMAFEVSADQNKDTLITAKRVFFQFSIADLLRKNYKIKRLEISDGKFMPVDHADGSNNYIFWKTSKDDPVNNFEFDLQRIDLVNFEINYKNLAQKRNYHVFLSESRMSGKFSQASFSMDISSKMRINELLIEETSFLSDSDVLLNLNLSVADKIMYRFEKGSLKLNGNTFEVEGYVKNEQPGSYLDIALTGKDIKLQNLINDFPEDLKKHFDGYRSSGNLYFNAIIKGKSSQTENPQIIANLGLTNGSLYNRKLDLHLDKISFKAQFNNGSRRSLASSIITVDDFYALINKGKVNSSFIISDFTDPSLVVNAKADIEAPDLINLLRIPNFETASGQMLFDIGFESKIKKMGVKINSSRSEFFASATSGSLLIKDVKFTLKDDYKKYHDFNGVFHFNDNDLIVSAFSGIVADNDFVMNGYFRNVLPYIFHEGQRMRIDANLASNYINLDELLQDRATKTDTTYKVTFSDRIDFHLLADIGYFRFRKFDATNLTGKLQMKNKKFMATDISFYSMNGKYTGTAYVDGTNENLLLIGCDASLYNVSAREMFYQFGNFGQKAIKDENIKGNITAEMQFTSNWSPNLQIDWKSLETTADIRVDNGELIDFKPLLALSKFLKVEDLEHVMFSTLYNNIRIKDRNIIIPDMEINSSAVNIKISGEHTFGNEIDYRLQVLLSELLAQKNRQRRNPQEQYGDIIDDGLGRTTLFLRLTGTVDDPVFRYDYQGVREKLRDDLQQERQELRLILKEEFSWITRDTLRRQEDSLLLERQKEMERIKKQEEGKFVIEFDDL